MRARAWAPAASALIYTVVTAILGREVLGHLGTSIANDTGDPLLTAAILHWNAHHVPWSDAWWQFPIYYPTRDTLAFSEHLLGLSVIASPIAWLTGDPLVTYNLAALLTFPLSGMAMYALVQYLTRSGAAAFIAGLAFAFAPYRMSTLPHIQMLASFWAPLALLGLHRYVDAVRLKPDATSTTDLRSVRLQPGPRWWLGLFGAAWALQAAANGYALVFFSVLVGLWVLWFVVARRHWRALGMIAAMAATASLPLVPILYKYATVHAYHGFERGLGEIREYSADVAAVLCAPASLTFWGWIRVACRGEGELFPGVALAVLCAAAMFYVLSGRPADFAKASALTWIRRVLLALAGVYALIVASVLIIGPWRLDAGFINVSATDTDKPLLVTIVAVVGVLLVSLGMRASARPASALTFYLFAAVATWALALGPTLTLMGEPSGRPGPFVLLQWLPGVDGLRVPARFWLITVICLTTAAGIFVADVLRGLRRSAAGVSIALVACALLADGWTGPIPAARVPPPVPDPAALRGHVVLEVPMDLYSDIASVWRAVTGGWRSVNGYSGFGPNYYAAATQASGSGGDQVFPPFQRDEELHVIVTDETHAVKAIVERQPDAIETARRGGMIQYRLPRRAPPPDVQLGAPLPIMAVRSSCAASEVSRSFDADEESYWLCRDTELQELTIDLGRAAIVGAVVYSAGPHNQIFPHEIMIETSIDGGVWIEARRGSILGELIAGGLRDPKVLRAALPFLPRQARYVRVRPVAQPPEFVWFVAGVAVRAP